MPDRRLKKSRRTDAAPAKPETRPAKRPRLDIGALDGHLGYFVRRLQVWVFQDFIRTLAPMDVRPAQYSVLLLIEANPGRSQAAIGQGPVAVTPLQMALVAEAVATGGTIYQPHVVQKIEGVKIPAKYSESRAGDVRDSQADTTAAVRELAHAPRFSIEEGLRRTLAWYRQTQPAKVGR